MTVKIKFDELPSLDTHQITSICGAPVENLTAEQLVAKCPGQYKIKKGRYGKELRARSEWGTPREKLTYMDGATEVTIYANDLVGGRPTHRPQRPTFPTNPQNP